MRKLLFLYSILTAVLLTSCKKEEAQTPQKGKITIEADESFKNVTEALTERYMAFYPEAELQVVYKKEDSALVDLLENRAGVIVMSRKLNEKEQKRYEEKVDMPYQPANFAGDAVVFVVPANAERQNLSIKEIEEMLQSEDKNLIFDGANASNLNFVAQTLNKKPSELKFSVIRGNENIIENLHQFPNKIGVISLNTISRNFSKDVEALKEKIKILPIIAENGKAYTPDLENIRTMQYPFSRILYFLTNEGFFGVGNGFIRFSCTQIGQIVVAKQGLQPYNLYKREVQMR
ncbi:PstS family phosphate ABC transporter substrate-binding protein [Riemerella columbina]|uniref:PstS family phosphate ABC transporter substrate-binding protein n=1 Tax=Riemerella columbina TaxID=103810 RepID=UPI00266F718A|nr:substrate-binding domain-containing protein [Riemerella columbina]WKS95083.1 substrate-binding domain-containing protein [Riemerella columbina]